MGGQGSSAIQSDSLQPTDADIIDRAAKEFVDDRPEAERGKIHRNLVLFGNCVDFWQQWAIGSYENYSL